MNRSLMSNITSLLESEPHLEMTSMITKLLSAPQRDSPEFIEAANTFFKIHSDSALTRAPAGYIMLRALLREICLHQQLEFSSTVAASLRKRARDCQDWDAANEYVYTELRFVVLYRLSQQTKYLRIDSALLVQLSDAKNDLVSLEYPSESIESLCRLKL